MLDIAQLEAYVVTPTLQQLGMRSDAAVRLMLGTAAHESCGFRYIRQLGGGPAHGLWQIELATLKSIYEDYLNYHPEKMAAIEQISGDPVPRSRRWEFLTSKLMTDLAFGCAIARLVYWRVPEPLPDSDDIAGLAGYWKSHYNTRLGAGTVVGFMESYDRYVAPYIREVAK